MWRYKSRRVLLYFERVPSENLGLADRRVAYCLVNGKTYEDPNGSALALGERMIKRKILGEHDRIEIETLPVNGRVYDLGANGAEIEPERSNTIPATITDYHCFVEGCNRAIRKKNMSKRLRKIMARRNEEDCEDSNFGLAGAVA